MERISGPGWVVCLGTDWYSPLESSIRQIVGEFRHRGCRVLWVNPLPIRFPDRKRPDFKKKIINKAKTHTRLLSRVAPDVTVFSPVYLPFFSPAGMQINRILVSIQIGLLLAVLGIRSPLVLASEFTAWYALPAIRRHPLFFHFADKISSFREVANQPEKRGRLEAMEQDLVAAAGLSGCSSRMIFEHVQTVARAIGLDPNRVRYLPHAVNSRVFAEAEGKPDPDDLMGIPHPIAGYFGSLTQTNDLETFSWAARKLPDWSFVFVGKVAGDYSDLEMMENVHFLGPKSHSEIPNYGRNFDICFMGWKPHEWITNCFPLKTLEYLLLGKPVICSSRISELAESFPDFIRFTRTPDEFVEALVEELEEDSPAKMAARRKAVGAFTWAKYVDEVLQSLPRGKAARKP